MLEYSKELLKHVVEGKYVLVLDTPSVDYREGGLPNEKYIDVLLQPNGYHTYMPTYRREYWDDESIGEDHYGCKRVNFIREVELRNL